MIIGHLHVKCSSEKKKNATQPRLGTIFSTMTSPLTVEAARSFAAIGHMPLITTTTAGAGLGFIKDHDLLTNHSHSERNRTTQTHACSTHTIIHTSGNTITVEGQTSPWNNNPPIRTVSGISFNHSLRW